MEPKIILVILFNTLIGFSVSAQIEIKGRVVDHVSGKYLQEVQIRFKKSRKPVFSDYGGYFHIVKIRQKSAELIFELRGYEELRIPVLLESNLEQVDLGLIKMLRLQEVNTKVDWAANNSIEFEIDQYEVENITGILNAGKDLFSRTAAYDFGSNFFRPRFLGSEHGIIMLNGVPLNKISTGRPEWSNWGGLNDALRRQERFNYMHSSPYNLGGLALGMNMISKASRQQEGGKFSMALSNKNYQSRVMLTYSSGVFKQGWAFMISGSLRKGDEGFRSGTNYTGYSFLASVDKQIGKKHNLNATFIYAYNNRGKSAPMTQEVFELKNVSYNSYWGYQQNKKRNAREKIILEPIFQLNHEFKLNKKVRFHNHFTYQTGSISTSRLDYGGARILKTSNTIVGGGMNPDPSYYQKLPSYFLKDPLSPEYGRAYLAEKEFQENGQINWDELYEANRNSSSENYAIYALYDDLQDSERWLLNSGFTTSFGNALSLDGSVHFSENSSQSYAYMTDLLGADGYLDIDPYAENNVAAQNNLQDPNRIVFDGEKFRYNYKLHARQMGAFMKLNYSTKKTDAFAGAEFESVSYRRNGIFENGAYPGPLSKGKSRKINFHSYGIKLGFSYKFNGRHILLLNANYLRKEPVLNHVFSNVRISNEIVKDLKLNTYTGLDLKYVWRHKYFHATLSGYYLMLNDESKIAFYYADGLTGLDNSESSAYVQEVLSGIDRQNSGLEFSIELPLLTNVKIKGVAAIGRSIYASNPKLYLNSNAFEGSLDLGQSFLKGYFSTGGPQSVYSIGLEYSSPNYWWLSGSFNFFDESFVSLAPITRTKNFFLDTDGLPIQELDPAIAQEMLRQESLPAYININLVGGKSWKIKNWYLGLFTSLNNLSNNFYKTGGYEQSRTANYLTLKEDKSRTKPLFGPKYWFGFGTTFFTSLYIRR